MTGPQGRTPEDLVKRGSIKPRECKQSVTQLAWRLTAVLSEWSTYCGLPAGGSGPHDFCVPSVLALCLQSQMQTNGECKPEQRVRDQLPRSLCKTQHAEQDLACYRFSNDVLSQYSGELVLLHENSAQCTKYCYELAFIVQETHNTGSFCLITYRGNPED